MARFTINIVGKSGSGLLSVGDILSNALLKAGFYLCSDREYPSLIKGGASRFMLTLDQEPVYSLDDECQLLIALDRYGIEGFKSKLAEGGTFIEAYDRPLKLKGIYEELKKRDINCLHLDAEQIIKQNQGSILMINTILLGYLFKLLNLPFNYLEDEIEARFKAKTSLIQPNVACALAAFNEAPLVDKLALSPSSDNSDSDLVAIDGNHALALGALEAGLGAYYAYPMSPASTILTYLAKMAEKGAPIIVKQVEDEIAAAQMTLGSSFMGARSLVGTSGGGFDLMTETVSLAGMIETPLVVVLGQRPGPATGLPTWTGQGDLNLAIYAGHGEFARLVLAVSDPRSAFKEIQNAFNFAEQYQIPVIVLTEKFIAESKLVSKKFNSKSIPIKRGLISSAQAKEQKRYQITDSGVSPRWLPLEGENYYHANCDEHDERGVITEESVDTEQMYAKRMRKLATIKSALPEPEIIGDPEKAQLTFVGWGSTLGVMRDLIKDFAQQDITISYLHYTYLWPLKTEKLQDFAAKNQHTYLIEGNYQGQLGELIQRELAIDFADKILKFDGRPFFFDELKAKITDLINFNG
jgi:2-oxoglutarate ferredoxin oxidoreductase subunit alpha